ncbi:MAG: hypothetical protein IT472_03390 [Thermomonas sp.]|uniref:hypothetical protein n=1 Tax=Thermomonas sp. TaxID=1971895 RepID=UPI0026266D58|nr:hypothetical protein [Thermomonas sp.]MCC7096207.1 hypothetical protein [Thermomonas sp.]
MSVDFDKMYKADLILGVAFMLGLLVVIIGAWGLMRSLKTKSSRLFFCSLTVFFCWIFFSESLFFSIFSYFDSEIPYQYIDASRVFLEVGVPALLMFSIAVNFLLVVRTISRESKIKEENRRTGTRTIHPFSYPLTGLI